MFWNNRRILSMLLVLAWELFQSRLSPLILTYHLHLSVVSGQPATNQQTNSLVERNQPTTPLQSYCQKPSDFVGAGFPDKTWKDCSLGSFGLWWLHAVLILLPPHFHCRANFIEHTRMMITISICDDSNRNYHNNENDKDTDNSDDTACRIVVKLILFLNWKKYKMYKISKSLIWSWECVLL